MHFFGAVGFVSFGLGAVAMLVSVILRLTGLRTFVSTPLPIISNVPMIGKGVDTNVRKPVRRKITETNFATAPNPTDAFFWSRGLCVVWIGGSRDVGLSYFTPDRFAYVRVHAFANHRHVTDYFGSAIHLVRF